jgi:hypothetical protein
MWLWVVHLALCDVGAMPGALGWLLAVPWTTCGLWCLLHAGGQRGLSTFLCVYAMAVAYGTPLWVLG